MDLSLSTFVCLFISFSICLSTSYLSACVSVNIHPPFHHFCVCVYVREYSRSLTIIIYLPLVNKEEVVQKARPVSSDVGSTNPNFSDLMDEFIQERLRAKGTAVNTRRTNTQILQVFSKFPGGRNWHLLLSSWYAGPSWQQPGKSGGSQRPAGAPRGRSESWIPTIRRSSPHWWSRGSLWMDVSCKCQRFWCHQLWQPVRLL